MPVMDGYDTIRNIKSMMRSGKVGKGIFIANTGFVDLETKSRCEAEGFNLYLSKPVRIKELEKYLNETFL